MLRLRDSGLFNLLDNIPLPEYTHEKPVRHIHNLHERMNEKGMGGGSDGLPPTEVKSANLTSHFHNPSLCVRLI